MRTEVKQLQNLYSWLEFYQTNKLNSQARKCEKQIEEHKTKFKLY